jgi:hypothetical protein
MKRRPFCIRNTICSEIQEVPIRTRSIEPDPRSGGCEPASVRIDRRSEVEIGPSTAQAVIQVKSRKWPTSIKAALHELRERPFS